MTDYDGWLHPRMCSCTSFFQEENNVLCIAMCIYSCDIKGARLCGWLLCGVSTVCNHSASRLASWQTAVESLLSFRLFTGCVGSKKKKTYYNFETEINLVFLYTIAQSPFCYNEIVKSWCNTLFQRLACFCISLVFMIFTIAAPWEYLQSKQAKSPWHHTPGGINRRLFGVRMKDRRLNEKCISQPHYILVNM